MSFRRYRLIVWKEVLQFSRDRLLFPVIFVMPILQLIMFGYVVGADVTHLSTAVVDLDGTATSRAIVQRFVSSGYFTVTATPSREASLQPLFDAAQIKVALVVEKGTEDRLTRGQSVPFGIVVDGADSKTASIASGYASQIVAQFNAERLRAAAAAMSGPVLDAQVRVVFNPSLKAVNAMIPGLIATILMVSITSIMSQAVVRERARGTLEQMMVTPISRGEYLAGKVTPYAVIAVVQMAFVAALGRWWFGVPFNGQFSTVVLGLVVFMFTSIGMGLLISLVSRNQHQAQQMVMFILIPTMVLSGFMFPIESMPPAVVPLTYLIPLRYALVVLRGAFLKGAGIADLWVPLAAMIAFSIVIFGVAVARFQKRLSD
jgi:ABC-2 type transport system permease protein